MTGETLCPITLPLVVVHIALVAIPRYVMALVTRRVIGSGDNKGKSRSPILYRLISLRLNTILH